MGIDATKVLEKFDLYEGQILFSQGSDIKSLNILHKGKLEFLYYPGDIEKDMDEISVAEHSLKLFSVSSYSFFGEREFILKLPSECTIKAETDINVSIYPASSLTFEKLAVSKTNIAIAMVRSLIKNIPVIRNKTIESYDFLKKVLKIYSIFPIVIYSLDVNLLKNGKKVLSDDIKQYSIELLRKIKEKEGDIPKNLSPELLGMDFSEFLINDNFNEEPLIDGFAFLKEFFSLEPNVQKAVLSKNIKLLIYGGKIGARIFDYYLNKLLGIVNETLKTLRIIFGDSGWLKGLVESFESRLAKENDNVELIEFYKGLYENLSGLLEGYKRLYSQEFSEVSSYFADMETRVSTFDDTVAEKEEGESGLEVDSLEDVDIQEVEATLPEELKNSMQQILDYVELDEETRKLFIKEYKAYMKLPNKFDIYSDARKHLRRIRDIYWKIYEKAFLNFYNDTKVGKRVPKPVELMLLFGYFDENALSLKTINMLYNFKDNTKYTFPIHYGWEWLKIIYECDRDLKKCKEPPSVNSLGETYEELLRKELRTKSKKEIEEEGGLDFPEKRLRHEIREAYSELVRLCSGSPITAFPILIEEQITVDLGKSILKKGILERQIKSILEIDFSAFYREVLWRSEDGSRKEFVMVEVIPNFIILPVAGSKAFMWQELATRDKRSRGRIFVPIIVTGDLEIMLLEAIGAFRWELTRTILGASWADPTQNSLTGDYFDYQSFYKKDKSLSEETKKKISEEFKKFRDVRARFVNDYIKWIKYESQGIMKLNKRVREIMFKHVPFPKNIRDKLKTFSPVYNDLNTRFENLRRKKLRELEVRYRKYKENGELPKELKENLEFYMK